MNIPTCDSEAIEQFLEWLQRARDGEVLDPPVHLITGDAEGYSSLDFDENQSFHRRWDVAEYYNSLLGANSDDWKRFISDEGALVACTILHFSSLCERKTDGTWEIRMDTKATSPREAFPYYIPLPRERRYYRHRIRGPMVVQNVGREFTRPILHGRAYQHGDFMEQVTGRPDKFLTPSILELTYRLYWNPETNSTHSGWSSTHKPRPDGVLRRLFGPESFTKVNEKTFDFMSMNTDQIIEMLPEEFNYWLALGEED